MAAPNFITQSGAAALPDDAELIARIAASDEAVYGTLYLAYFERLWKFAYSYVRSPEIAEELVQDVFLALWRDRAGLDVRATVRAWLYAAVRHHALNYLRHERIVGQLQERTAVRRDTGSAIDHSEAVASVATMATQFPNAHACVEAQELDDAVVRALAALPERRRIAMTLRWKHDMSPIEIARVLGTTPESVRVLLTRARQDLSTLLGRATKAS